MTEDQKSKINECLRVLKVVRRELEEELVELNEDSEKYNICETELSFIEEAISKLKRI